MLRTVAVASIVLVAACDRAKSKEQPPPAATTNAEPAKPPPLPTASLDGDAREAARSVFGVPPKPGRVIGTVEAFTNGDPQVNAAGVLAVSGAQGRVVTVYAAADGLHVASGIDLGTVRYLATDGANVCASDKRALRCAKVDGGSIGQRSTDTTETAGIWGGAGVMLRATMRGLETGLEASDDGFLTARRVGLPPRRLVVAAVVESPQRWTSVLMPREGTNPKPRYGLTIDGGKTPIADFGALDRAGWSSGDRLWPDQLVTSAFSTETVVAERGEKQSVLALPWSASGGFAFARRALLLFGRGASGTGGFLLVEFPSRRVTSFTPGAQPIVAAGRVGGAIVAITTEGKVLAWEG